MLIKVNSGVFLCVLGAYDIYKKNTDLLTSHTILLLLRLKFRSARGAFHPSAFMGRFLTISHTFFALSTK